MTKKKHPLSRKERMELDTKHREKKKNKSVRTILKDEIREQETSDELKSYDP